MLILEIFFFAAPGYKLSKSSIFYDRKICQKILGSPALWKIRDKMSLKYIETRMEITISCEDTQLNTELTKFLYSVSLR